jgi:hypothetical protein
VSVVVEQRLRYLSDDGGSGWVVVNGGIVVVAKVVGGGSIQKCKRLEKVQHDHVHRTLNELS